MGIQRRPPYLSPVTHKTTEDTRCVNGCLIQSVPKGLATSIIYWQVLHVDGLLRLGWLYREKTAGGTGLGQGGKRWQPHLGPSVGAQGGRHPPNPTARTSAPQGCGRTEASNVSIYFDFSWLPRVAGKGTMKEEDVKITDKALTSCGHHLGSPNLLHLLQEIHPLLREGGLTSHLCTFLCAH